MTVDAIPLRIVDRVRLRPGSLPPPSQLPYYDSSTFVAVHLDRSREAAGDVQVTIRAVTGAGPSLTVPSGALQRAALLPKLPPGTVDQTQQFSDRSMRFIRMSERLIRSDSVVVLTADLFAVDDSAGLKIGNDPLHGPLGDSDVQCHFSKHQGRLSRQEHQDVSMIRQNRPMGTRR